MADEARRVSDVLDPARASALLSTLGDPSKIKAGDPLPAFFQHAYFWEALTPDKLGPDGHPAVGGFIPDLGFARRMWAGGALRFHAPLRAGQEAEKVSQVIKADRKEGRAGPMGLVTVRHEFFQADKLCITEDQDLVYLPADFQRPPPRKAPAHAEASEQHSFTTTQLFRYSALTFNGHRIHYDLDYAKSVEGYAGLVVHGPILAQILIRMAEAQLGRLKGFRFRALVPVMHTESVMACRSGKELWIAKDDGTLCIQATADPI